MIAPGLQAYRHGEVERLRATCSITRISIDGIELIQERSHLSITAWAVKRKQPPTETSEEYGQPQKVMQLHDTSLLSMAHSAALNDVVPSIGRNDSGSSQSARALAPAKLNQTSISVESQANVDDNDHML